MVAPTTGKTSPITTNFSKGIKTYRPNDLMGNDELSLAQDARFDRIGEYITRKGFNKLSDPIGKAIAFNNTSEAYEMSAIPQIASFPFSSDRRMWSIKVKVSSEDDERYGILQATLKRGDEVLAVSCLDPDLVTPTPTDREMCFIDAPDVKSGETLTVEIGLQRGGTREYKVATVSGVLMTTGYSATAGEINNVFEANINGVKTVLFSHNEKLYRMSDDGAVTKIRDLPAGTKTVRFNQDLNQIRYVDGKEGPRLLDPANSWADTAIITVDHKTDTDLGIKTSNIADGTQDNMLYFDAETDTQAVWTYPYGFTWFKPAIFQTTSEISQSIDAITTITASTITRISSTGDNAVVVGDRVVDPQARKGEITAISGGNVTLKTLGAAEPINSYDKFDRDFRQNFPAILTGDPLTAMFELGGVHYFLTRRNKYQMYASTADTWSQSQHQAQNGTFSQESLVCDLNYAYFANDSGIYMFDGASEDSIVDESIQNVYDAIPDKESIRLDMFKNRLYVFYSSKGAENDSCLVYNIALRVWESFDTNTYVSATSARQNVSSRFICGHSRVGVLMLAEEKTNKYDNLGAPLAWNMETAYNHYGSTSQLKRITKWRPEFAVSQKPYSVQCGVATDFSETVKYTFSVDLKDGTTQDESYEWNNPSNHGNEVVKTKHPTTTEVYGEFYRCQIRYQHIAAFEPVLFRSHTLTVETQRLR